MIKNLADQTHWENLNKKHRFFKARDPFIKNWVMKYLPGGNYSDCIEVGCFPGSYQHIFGDMGCELNGIDLMPGTDSALPQWLASGNYKVGKFIRADFLEHDFRGQQFDIVVSLGFIEHFTDWKPVLKKHCDLVKPGGILIIEAPNFRGIVQQLLHRTVDGENFRRHNVSSMNPGKWEQVISAENFSTLFKGYFGGWDYWIEEQERNRLQKFLLKLLHGYNWRLKKIFSSDSPHYSQLCGIIARKN